MFNLLKMRNAKKHSISLLVLLFSLVLSAQAQREVKGKVTDEKGQPVPAASVTVKGTRVGATTSNDGTFTVKADTYQRNVLSNNPYTNSELYERCGCGRVW